MSAWDFVGNSAFTSFMSLCCNSTMGEAESGDGDSMPNIQNYAVILTQPLYRLQVCPYHMQQIKDAQRNMIINKFSKTYRGKDAVSYLLPQMLRERSSIGLGPVFPAVMPRHMLCACRRTPLSFRAAFATTLCRPCRTRRTCSSCPSCRRLVRTGLLQVARLVAGACQIVP